MPILKTEILGSIIEIDYQEAEKEKLLKIIKRFNSRISEFKEVYNKISDSKIIFLDKNIGYSKILNYKCKMLWIALSQLSIHIFNFHSYFH